MFIAVDVEKTSDDKYQVLLIWLWIGRRVRTIDLNFTPLLPSIITRCFFLSESQFSPLSLLSLSIYLSQLFLWCVCVYGKGCKKVLPDKAHAARDFVSGVETEIRTS